MSFIRNIFIYFSTIFISNLSNTCIITERDSRKYNSLMPQNISLHGPGAYFSLKLAQSWDFICVSLFHLHLAPSPSLSRESLGSQCWLSHTSTLVSIVTTSGTPALLVDHSQSTEKSKNIYMVQLFT